MARVTKKATVHSITLKHINEKLDHIHKDIDQNTKDIAKLKEQVAMGRGGIKVVFWLGAISVSYTHLTLPTILLV